MNEMSYRVSLPAYKTMQFHQPIDYSVLNDLKVVMGEQGSNSLSDLIDLFLTDAPSCLREMRKMAEAGFWENILHTANLLRGCCESLGAFEMASGCRKIELFLSGMEKDNYSEIKAENFLNLVVQIEDAYSRAASELILIGAEY
jgi:HPt (histidine-containing phosphotransfer) domain-containing protein